MTCLAIRTLGILYCTNLPASALLIYYTYVYYARAVASVGAFDQSIETTLSEPELVTITAVADDTAPTYTTTTTPHGSRVFQDKTNTSGGSLLNN